jgi:predicted GNAT family acetyltransferase
MTVDVVHRPEQSRFEATVKGGPAVLVYQRDGGTVTMLHTVVPVEAEGQGVAGALAATAVGWAREEGLEIVPQCSYVRSWLERHG